MEMIFEYENYRSYLKAELVERANKNPGYSLRAFAKKLGIASSFLSEVIQGKKTISGNAASKLALQLELNETETRYFCLLAQLESEKNPLHRETIQNRLKEINPRRQTNDLSIDIFKAIADWYHFALLELTALKSFALTPQSASLKLGISRAEADAAIDRLQRLELLEKDKNGHFQKTNDNVLFESAAPSGALKIYHKQLLEKALTSLVEQTPEERISSTDIVAIDSKYTKEVKKLSDQFTSELFKLAEKSRVKNKVYCLSVHFFNLTKDRR